MIDKYLDIEQIQEIRVHSTVFFGCGAIEKINFIAEQLKARGIVKVLIVTTRNAYKASGAWEPIVKALEAKGVKYLHYNKVTPNPTTDSIDEIASLGLEFGAGAVIGLGGGSPIDAAKSAAILMKYPGKTGQELYTGAFQPESALPIIAINLTHGTGSEANRFAVATVVSQDFKPAIAFDCIYPTWSIDDPDLMLTLPDKHVLYTSLDAVNHVIEAATTVLANPFAITTAREVIALVAENLPKAIKNSQDRAARYGLAYAAMLGGISFDNGLLHLTHALEHPLSAIKHDLTHGLGLVILLPSVIKAIYPAKAAILADILSPVVPGLQGNAQESQDVALAVEKWLLSLGVSEKLEDVGFKAEDVERLVKLTFSTPSLPGLLSIAPVKADEKLVGDIYRSSLKPLALAK